MTENDADRGDLRKRFRAGRAGAPRSGAPPEPAAPPPAGAGPAADDTYADLVATLANDVGKTVNAATALALNILEDVGLAALERMSPTKAAAAPGVRGVAASLMSRARTTLPGVSERTAFVVTDVAVSGGFALLRAMHELVGKSGRPG